uniref:Serpin-ZX n=1 Tax=Tanacetum cinerariifolium TaxID=118510 RepID=A0A6L2J1S7_TANCI|nr:serpin-ZX [Tanacetum cinerariifolium]
MNMQLQDPISKDLANAPLSHGVLKKTTVPANNRSAQELHEIELMITSMNKKILNKKLADPPPHSYEEEKLSKMKESLEKLGEQIIFTKLNGYKNGNLSSTHLMRSSAFVVTKTLVDDANNGYKNGNFACSPLSLDISLGMLAAGAEGETLKHLLVFLGHESIGNFFAQSPSLILLK